MVDCARLLPSLLLLLALGPSGPVAEASTASKNILMLGGNGLIGGHTARRLHAAGHRLTIIHRGNAYWDWSTLLAGHFERMLRCDRTHPLYRCDDFVELAENSPVFDIVMDFSGFTSTMVDNVIEDLAGLFRRYIFISTDSVYEVSANKTHQGLTREEDAVRPISPKTRLQLAIKDPYAENKMRCEERLKYYAKKDGFPLLSLRLPDVIGPRDSTVRFWAYVAALELAGETKQVLQVPTFAKEWPISFVYVDDVARLMVKLAGEAIVKPAAGGEVEMINFANPDTMSLVQMLDRVKGIIELKGVRLQVAKDPAALMPRYLMPSVTRGAIDTKRSQEKWKFSFTSWDSAFRTTIKFYRNYLKTMKSKEPWKDPVVVRLHEAISHLEGLRLFDKKIWEKFLTAQVGKPPKQEL